MVRRFRRRNCYSKPLKRFETPWLPSSSSLRTHRQPNPSLSSKAHERATTRSIEFPPPRSQIRQPEKRKEGDYRASRSNRINSLLAPQSSLSAGVYASELAIPATQRPQRVAAGSGAMSIIKISIAQVHPPASPLLDPLREAPAEGLIPIETSVKVWRQVSRFRDECLRGMSKPLGIAQCFQ